MSSAGRHTLRCPDCGSELVVDATTGEILTHRKAAAPAGGGKSFDALFADLAANQASAADRFDREQAAFADRERLLDEKFKEAMKRADEEPDTPLVRPFDFD